MNIRITYEISGPFKDTVTRYEATGVAGMADEEIKKRIGWVDEADNWVSYFRDYEREGDTAKWEKVLTFLD